MGHTMNGLWSSTHKIHTCCAAVRTIIIVLSNTDATKWRVAQQQGREEGGVLSLSVCVGAPGPVGGGLPEHTHTLTHTHTHTHTQPSAGGSRTSRPKRNKPPLLAHSLLRFFLLSPSCMCLCPLSLSFAPSRSLTLSLKTRPFSLSSRLSLRSRETLETLSRLSLRSRDSRSALETLAPLSRLSVLA